MSAPSAHAPIDTILDRLAGRSHQARRNGAGWAARCPAHDDNKPSLSISEGDDGRALLYCQAGCPLDAVLAALDLEQGDLFPSRPETERGRITATYDYTDERGELLYQVVRFHPKDFRQRRPDGNGGWTWALGDTRRVLYKLPSIHRAIVAGDPVYVCEGEKDVHAAEAVGAVATTNPGGAGKWRPEYTQALASASVVVVADADLPGRTHARKVAVALDGVAAAVEIQEPLTGKDLADHLSAGHTLDDLAPVENPPPPPAEPELTDDDADAGGHNLTDLGNARRLVEAHGNDLRYVPQWSTWLVWDGRRWARDITGEIHRRAKAVAESLFTEAMTKADSDDRKKAFAWAFRSESAARLRAMIDVATTEPGIPIQPHEVDADPWLLTVDNGTIDLRTGAVSAHQRADLITKAAPVVYDPNAISETWDRFLTDVTGSDTRLAGFLQRAVGYSLTGDTREEVLFFAHGPAASGKSTFFGAIAAALGDWARHADFETFLARQDAGGPRGDIARLAGARFVDSIEVDEGKKLAEGLIKTLTGGDTITAAFKYRDDFEFRPAFKLWLAANHAPKIRYGDEAMWRRILRVPFEHAVPKEARDPEIKAELTDPARAGAAILAWAVAGCLDWQDRGLAVPDSVTAATETYRADMDPLGEFLEEYCTLEDPGQWVTAGQLRENYEEWAKENAVRHTVSTKVFRDVLREHGCEPSMRRVGGKPCRIWTGIGLLDGATRNAVDARNVTSRESSREEENKEKSSEMPLRASTRIHPTATGGVSSQIPLDHDEDEPLPAPGEPF